MTIVELLAPAKLTLSLRITGRREDGYHLIDAEMVTVDLCDTLRVDPEGHGVTVVADETPTEWVGDQAGDNLVTRALRLAGVDAGVELTKRIPAGAGLGGGSADAAAILRWAGYDDPIGAATIGADVAFCLVGGRARVRGIGEVVEPLGFVERTFTIATPPVHCSTPRVYEMWDSMGGPVGPSGNDLEPAALRVAPELASTRDALGEATGRTPRLAGSGSSWFVEGEYPGAGRVVRTVPAARSRPAGVSP